MTENRQKLVAGFLGLILLVLILAIMIMAAVPPVSRDALTHHLAVPKLWIAKGGIHETPNISFSYYPMNLDLLYSVPLIFGNDILPKFVHMAFGLFTAVFLYRYLRNRLNQRYGLIGALFFLSLPIIIQLSITVYVDLGLIFFSTAALTYLLEWRQHDLQNRYLLLAAIFCGLALGTKYNGLLVFLLLTLLVLFVANRKAVTLIALNGKAGYWQRIVIPTMIFAAVALLLFAPWVVRNILWTGNPLYPLYDTLFNPQNPYVETRLNPFAMRRLVYGETLWETLLVPIRIFFQGQDDFPALFDGRLNPFLLPLAIVGLLPSKRQSPGLQFEKAVWGIFALLFILIVFFTRDMRIRYIAPAIPPLVILSVFGIRNVYSWVHYGSNNAMRQGLQIAATIGVLFMFTLNAEYLYQKWESVRPLEYIGGQVDRAAYITRHRPEYPLVRYANQHLMEGDRILCVFLGNRRYYFEIDTLFYEWPQFKDLVVRASDAQALTDAMIQKGLTHVMVGMEGLRYWSQQNLTTKDQAKVRRWLQNDLETIAEKNGYALFKLRLDSEKK